MNPITNPCPIYSVYRAVAQKRPWYIRPSRRRCVATALHSAVIYTAYILMDYVVVILHVLVKRYLRFVGIHCLHLHGNGS
jgi:hypothetical protein